MGTTGARDGTGSRGVEPSRRSMTRHQRDMFPIPHWSIQFVTLAGLVIRYDL